MLSAKTSLIWKVFILIILVSLTVGIGGCGVKAVPNPPVGDDYPDPPPEDPAPAALACPKEMTEFMIFVSHTWDFSPNRDTEMMKVDGKTEPSSACPVTIAGETVIMEECRVPFTSTGYVKTDDGMCDITASGTALITVEDASCDDAKVTMTIVEVMDADTAPTGAMNCPNTSQPYIPFYPFSSTTRTFHIQVGGTTMTEEMNPDLSNQFKYYKEWTLYSETLLSPVPED